MLQISRLRLRESSGEYEHLHKDIKPSCGLGRDLMFVAISDDAVSQQHRGPFLKMTNMHRSRSSLMSYKGPTPKGVSMDLSAAPQMIVIAVPPMEERRARTNSPIRRRLVCLWLEILLFAARPSAGKSKISESLP
jgi:hypothetical protein